MLLAGGHSQRFGSDKRQAQLADGRTLLDTTIDQVLLSGLPLLVCLPENSQLTAAALAARNVGTVLCSDAQQGMGATRVLRHANGVTLILEQVPNHLAYGVVIVHNKNVERPAGKARASGCCCLDSEVFEQYTESMGDDLEKKLEVEMEAQAKKMEAEIAKAEAAAAAQPATPPSPKSHTWTRRSGAFGSSGTAEAGKAPIKTAAKHRKHIAEYSNMQSS